MPEDNEERTGKIRRKFAYLPRTVYKRMRRARVSEERDIGVYVIGRPGRGTIILRDCQMNWETGNVDPTVFTLDVPVSSLSTLMDAINSALEEWQEEGEGVSGNRRADEMGDQ